MGGTWWEKLYHALVSRPCSVKSFNPIIFWWVELCSLPVNCLARDDPALGSTGSMVGIMATFKGMKCQGKPSRTASTSSPVPVDEPLPTKHQQVWLGLLWHQCFFPLGLGVCKILVLLSKGGICFPVLWKSYSQILLDFKADLPWAFPVPLPDSQVVKTDKFQNLHNGGKLWCCYSPVCESPT